MIRVALVIGRLNVGGAEAEIVRLANGLDRAKFAPFVVTLQDRGPLARTLRDVEVVELGFRKKTSWGAYRALKRFLRERKPDVVQSFLFVENIFCRRIGQGIVVSGLQGSLSDDYETGPSWRLTLERATFGRAAAVISNSEYYRSLYAGLGLEASKIVTIPSAVEPIETRGEETRRRLGVGNDQVLVACVARLVERKGHEDLIRAAAGFPLVFVGDGPMRRRLEGRGAILAGEVENPRDYMAAADIVALPARFGEGCSNAVLEAMAAGRPIVAAKAGGLPEIVVDGETGILVPPRDPAALRAALEKLAADPALRGRMGQAGRERALRNFSVERMVRSYEDVYFKLTDRRPSL